MKDHSSGALTVGTCSGYLYSLYNPDCNIIQFSININILVVMSVNRGFNSVAIND